MIFILICAVIAAVFLHSFLPPIVTSFAKGVLAVVGVIITMVVVCMVLLGVPVRATFWALLS